MHCPGWLDKPAVKISASLLLAFFLLYRAGLFYLQAFHGFAWDYSINWTAALALREGLSLYDRPALQQLAIAHIDSGMSGLFGGRFTSFIGLPTTAIAHLPFTALAFDTSVWCYRVLSLLAMLAAVVITGLAVPPAHRRRTWLVGVLCLLTWHAVPFSLQLGQVDAWVLLSLATAVFSASRQRWLGCGMAIGLAVLLKISPAWLLFYCLLQQRWRVLAGAALAIGAGLLLALLSQHGRDLLQFFTVILPSLGDSPLHVQNQSLGAWLARLATADVQLLSFAAGVGGWKLVGAAVAGLLLLLLHRRAGKAVSADGLAIAILLALLAGPLTWDHYLLWAIVPVMLCSVQLSGRGLWLLLVLLLPLAWPVPYPPADAVAAHAVWRLATGLQVLSVLLLACWLVWQRRPAGR